MAPKFFGKGNQWINLKHVNGIKVVDNKIYFFINEDGFKSMKQFFPIFDDRCIVITYESKEQAETALRAVMES